MGGNCAIANYINERGQVAGTSETTTTPDPATGIPPQDPFLWQDGKMTDLGTLGGAIGFPLSLNNRGQVVGLSSTSASPGACLTEGDPDCHPFLWEHGNLIDLGRTSIGESPITPDGFNDAREIVGAADFSSSGGSPFDAYLLVNGVATDLGALGGDCFSRAIAINSHAQVVAIPFRATATFTVRSFGRTARSLTLTLSSQRIHPCNWRVEVMSTTEGRLRLSVCLLEFHQQISLPKGTPSC